MKFENEGNRVWGNLYFLKIELKEGDLCLQESEVAGVEMWSIQEI